MKIRDVDPAAITDAEKIAELEREIKARWQVYPRLISAGKISERQMHHRIAVMIAIRDEIRARVARAANEQGSLL